jgi:signal peptidase I
LPTLWVHDHVLVNKFIYGFRLPFTKHYLIRWNSIKRGDIIVFRYPQKEDVFYVKRVLGLPGESIKWVGNKVFINNVLLEHVPLEDKEFHPGGDSSLVTDYEIVPIDSENDEEDLVKLSPDSDEEGLAKLSPENGDRGLAKPSSEAVAKSSQFLYKENAWIVHYASSSDSSSASSSLEEEGEYKIPHDEVFVMGDNRDHSYDSRFWGGVKISLVLGQVSRVWMACDKMLDPTIRFCNPATIFWKRLGFKPQ